MAYRVLARVYRSATFEDVVGQEPIATTLTNAIRTGRVHHGYLFTGTRGVGKTSMARILAKSLNCLAHDSPTPTPCCECDSCRAIAIGEDVDVVEIDAASNTGVDNIRELRNNATLRPARARYKIYIIDEVHMLSTGAFNALLKTLEEPPEHVKFILATTEAHKVPATIQSRCQRFDFRAIDATAIRDHLARIVSQEGIDAEDFVLRRIARLANGSMRDALSLLDKLLSYEPTHLSAEIIDEVLPPPHDELAGRLMTCVAEGDAAGALKALDFALQSGRTVERFCEHLIEHVRTLMVLGVCGRDTELVDVSGSARPILYEQARTFDASTYVYMIALLEELRRNIKYSGAGRALADAAVVRLAQAHRFTDIEVLMAHLNGKPAGTETAGIEGSAHASRSVSHSLPQSQPKMSLGETAGSSEGSRIPVEPRRPSTNRRAEPEASQTAKASQSHMESSPSSQGNPAPTPASNVEKSRGLSGTPETRRITPAERERALRDPLVQRVQEEVEGMLLDVRPVQPSSRPRPSASSAGEEAGQGL